MNLLSRLSPSCWPSDRRLVGLVIKASTSSGGSRVRFPRAPRGFFSGSSHTSDLQTGTTVTALPGVWRYNSDNGADPFLRYTSMLLGH